MILMKLGEEYKLYSHDSCIATTQESPHKRLSKQNCDEIFGVVDVEKLAESHAEECYERNGDPLEESYFENRKYNFKEGFNKAMELNKDKLFTVEDVRKAMSIGLSIGYGRQFEIENKSVEIDSYIKSLQQPTEIEVEIVTHVDLAATPTDSRHPDAYLGTDTGIPFLDENGCLILKKK
jgi:hypothetical protein